MGMGAALGILTVWVAVVILAVLGAWGYVEVGFKIRRWRRRRQGGR